MCAICIAPAPGQGRNLLYLPWEKWILALPERTVRIFQLVIEWEPNPPQGALVGRAILDSRVQPITLSLDLCDYHPRIRCTSPIGRLHPETDWEDVISDAGRTGARIGAIPDGDTGLFDLTVEEDVLLSAVPEHDAARVRILLTRVIDVNRHHL